MDNIRFQKESTVRFVTRNGLPFRIQSLHSRYHIRAANASAERLFKKSAFFESGVAADRCRHAIYSQSRRRQNAKDIATNPASGRIRKKRAIAIAVRADNRIQSLLRPFSTQFHIFGAHGLGINWDKRIGPSERNDKSPQTLKDFRHQIPSHGGMLVHADSQAGKSPVAKKLQITPAIIFSGFQIFFRKRNCGSEHAVGIKFGVVHFKNFFADAEFVLLGNFTLGMIELDAVSVCGNVASRHHDCRQRFVDAIQRNRRTRNAPTVNDFPAHIDSRRRQSL